jgi:hypothetical protein
MKKTFPLLLAAMIFGCTQPKDIQMNLTDVQLVRIDTVQRYQNAKEKILTWQDKNHVSYVTFVPVEIYYPLGTRMKVMVKR